MLHIVTVRKNYTDNLSQNGMHMGYWLCDTDDDAAKEVGNSFLSMWDKYGYLLPWLNEKV